ncbi:hypothetical protein Dimus_025345 [Dionaea muscipula]
MVRRGRPPKIRVELGKEKSNGALSEEVNLVDVVVADGQIDLGLGCGLEEPSRRRIGEAKEAVQGVEVEQSKRSRLDGPRFDHLLSTHVKRAKQKKDWGGQGGCAGCGGRAEAREADLLRRTYGAYPSSEHCRAGHGAWW